MSIVYRRTVPLLVTVVFLILMVAEYFFASDLLRSIGLEMQSWAVLIAAFAVGLGVVTILRHHGMRVVKRSEGWMLSAWLMGVMIVFMVLGIGFGQGNPTFKWIYSNIYSALDSATYSILALFITSAAFRAFRARNLDAAVLLIAGFMILLGSTPTIAAMWDGLRYVSGWIMDVPTAATGRVIVIGAALGLITLALRMIIGKETGFLGGGAGETT